MTASRKELLPKARKHDLVIESLVDEVLVYDLKRHKALCLNVTAALVWKLCDGRTTVGQAAERIRARVNAPMDEDIIRLALDRLGKEHLLEGSGGPPASGKGVSRREAIRLGLAAAVALPLVTSIVAPTAAQTATCTSTCTSRNPLNCGNTPCCNGVGLTCKAHNNVCECLP